MQSARAASISQYFRQTGVTTSFATTFIIHPAWLGLDIHTTHLTQGGKQKWSGRATYGPHHSIQHEALVLGDGFKRDNGVRHVFDTSLRLESTWDEG